MTSEPRRWICWPDPDRVCLAGNCAQCAVRPDRRLVTRSWVVRYAESNGMVLEDTWLTNPAYQQSA